MITVAALYEFKEWLNYHELRHPIREFCKKHQIKGTLLLAQEGINGTVAGPREGINALKLYLENELFFNNMEYKESFADDYPFYRLKVRVKKEIVTLRKPESVPSKAVGEYVEPKDWNDLISDPDIIVIDTRNDYEYKVGTFQGAMNPQTKNFLEFPDYIENNHKLDHRKKVAMFCTGGIRCERASSYMLSKGFEHVYHLKGGILKYLEEVPVENSLWKGECFVFDQRIAVTHGLKKGSFSMCYGCREPLSKEDMSLPSYEEGVSCYRCFDKLTETRKKRSRDRQKQINLAKQRKQQHFGRETV